MVHQFSLNEISPTCDLKVLISTDYKLADNRWAETLKSYSLACTKDFYSQTRPFLAVRWTGQSGLPWGRFFSMVHVHV